jgi:hypothetical protein
MKMILETDRLPNIVQDFLRHADTLRKLIENSTLEIVEDIKSMLYDRESKLLLADAQYILTRFQSLDGLTAVE